MQFFGGNSDNLLVKTLLKGSIFGTFATAGKIKEDIVPAIEFGSSLAEGLSYTSEKTQELNDEVLEIYNINDKESQEEFINNTLEYFKGKGRFLDLNVDITDDLAILLNPQETNKLMANIMQYSEFMHSEEYKNYLANNDTLVQEDKATIQNCLDICDFMNLGSELNNDSAIYAQDSPWKEVETKTNDESGFFGQVYINEETKELIIGLCGTNNIKDLTSDDLDMMMKQVPDQYQDALNLYNEYANNEEYKDYNFTITGHSLGGSVAQLLAATDGVSNSSNPPKIITFNAFGTYNIIQDENNEDYNFVDIENIADNQIYNYITEGDLVSCTTRQIGQTTLVPNISPFAHMTASVHSYLNGVESV